MFRVKIQLPKELAGQYVERIKTGVRGVGYVKVKDSAVWPARLQNLVTPARRRRRRVTGSLHGVSRVAIAGVGGEPVVSIKDVTHRYRKVVALDGISLDIPARHHGRHRRPRRRRQVDADGAGRRLEEDAGGEGDRPRRRHRRRPASARRGPAHRVHAAGAGQEPVSGAQRLTTTSTSWRGCSGCRAAERKVRVKELLEATGLGPFADRPAGKLSGGMKQKVGLCGALVHDPDLLILDEPTTGVDPLSRRQFWTLIDDIRAGRPGMSVVISTAYMDEAQQWDWIVAMDAGRVLATGTPAELMAADGHERSGAVLHRAAARGEAQGPHGARRSRRARRQGGDRHRGARPDARASAPSPPSITSRCRSSAARSSASSARTAAASRRR